MTFKHIEKTLIESYRTVIIISGAQS